MDAFVVLQVGCVIGAFALCGVPFGLIIALRMNGVDVRELGSGNIGMTNVARSVGASAAALTFGCDVGKGLLSMWLTRLAMSLCLPAGLSFEPSSEGFAVLTTVYAACVFGHIFSPYLGFHGGKGVAVGFGAALGLHWPSALLMMLCFDLVAFPSRYVSAGSIVGSLSLPIILGVLFQATPWSLVPVAIACCTVIWAHRTNIVKLVHGQERKFTVKKKAEPKRPDAPTIRRDTKKDEEDE